MDVSVSFPSILKNSHINQKKECTQSSWNSKDPILSKRERLFFRVDEKHITCMNISGYEGKKNVWIDKEVLKSFSFMWDWIGETSL